MQRHEITLTLDASPAGLASQSLSRLLPMNDSTLSGRLTGQPLPGLLPLNETPALAWSASDGGSLNPDAGLDHVAGKDTIAGQG